MNVPAVDEGSAASRAKDEQIAAEPTLALPTLPADTAPAPMESHLRKLRRRLVAIVGVVENGLVRPLDPEVKLPEQARVIIVTSKAI
jgi:hypothetical protein